MIKILYYSSVVSYLTFSLTFSFVTYLSLINIRLCLGWNYLNKSVFVGWAAILVALADVVTVGLQIKLSLRIKFYYLPILKMAALS